MLISDRWYAVLDSKEVPRGKPVGVRRLGESLVFWRDDKGEICVMLDRCPHRSSKLSIGRIVNGCIQCPFHGFEFATDGSCKLIPANGRAAKIPRVFQCNVYWLMREVSWSSKGKPERAYAKWLVLNYVWGQIGSILRGKSRPRLFRIACEQQMDGVVVPLCKYIDGVFVEALKFFRVSRGTGDTAIDVSAFFKSKRGLEKDFKKHIESIPDSRALVNQKLLERFKAAIDDSVA